VNDDGSHLASVTTALHDKPTLVLIPLRLGIDKLDHNVFDSLKVLPHSCLTSPRPLDLLLDDVRIAILNRSNRRTTWIGLLLHWLFR
jgi:hypothetical protein